MTSKKNSFLRLFLVALTFRSCISWAQQSTSPDPTNESEQTESVDGKTIRRIVVEGLTVLPADTILSKIPFEQGDTFDAHATSAAIKKIYELGYFRQIEFEVAPVDSDQIDLYVVLEEKTLVKELVFKGNRHVSESDLKKKLGDQLIAVESRELKKYALALQQFYAEKNYHFATVTPSLEVDADGKGTVVFTIKEGPMALVKKVRFEGNEHFSGKKLRSLLFTREDWILAPLDRAGTYNPLAVEQDRDTLERFYQSNGYLNAKVPKANITFDDKKREITVTFIIQEGELYTISSIKAPGNDLISEEELLEIIPIRTGQLYSKEFVRFSIDRLRMKWGSLGYIYADIDPSIEPDDEKKTVAITFFSHPGNRVHVNRVNILGNEKGRDKVIRRQLLIEEGDLLTTPGMEESKNRVAQLGYFDPKEGVNWRINRIDEETADIDLLVKEIKTGRFEWKTSYGGSPTRLDSSNTGLMGELSMSDRNLFGKGLFAQVVGRMSLEEKAFNASFADPWFCDKPIRLGFDIIYNHTSYDEIKQVAQTVGEKQQGASINLGFAVKKLDDVIFLFESGFQNINYLGNAPRAVVNSGPVDQAEYQLILDQRFLGGRFAFFQGSMRKNTLNHHLHVTEGYKWDLTSKVAIPSLGDSIISFYKIEGDAHWYTPIIGDYQLVFHAHIHGGMLHSIHERIIPYRELFSIGGPASVRAWRFGQISPMWYTSDLASVDGWQGESIGGKKAMFVNLELVFPITSNLTMKGSVFYDGGSGWDTPDAKSIRPDHLRNNSFDYRHCIGIGIRLLEPQPIRVDWGFKLDRRTGESASEVQFSGYYDF